MPAQKLKVQKVPFSIVVDKSQSILTLILQDEVVKTYTVSTGKNNSTPVGSFKIKDKLIADVKQRVTSIKHVLGKEIPFKEVAGAMKAGFEEEFHVELVEGTLTEEEVALTRKFEKECFSAEEWNHRR